MDRRVDRREPDAHPGAAGAAGFMMRSFLAMYRMDQASTRHGC
jgi:hypothetical protein